MKTKNLLGQPLQSGQRSILGKRFRWPPFSVFNAREGAWQNRKREWVSLGIQSELGRGDDLRKFSDTVSYFVDEKGKKTTGKKNLKGDVEEYVSKQNGTSIFDPVICELVYRWFSPTNGIILDPFAGGSVRGIVASVLGRDYVGVDLRSEQIAANEQQAAKICKVGKEPIWIEGDSRDTINLVGEFKFDLIFSCPPYFDLELYSGDNRDLSNTTWEEFYESYNQIINHSVSLLNNDRFACFVVGDIRDKQGFYRNLPAVTIDCFEKAGCHLFNDVILVTSVGSLPLRVHKQFTKSRKLGRTHQSVLVFVKGDPVEAAKACEELELISMDIGEFNE